MKNLFLIISTSFIFSISAYGTKEVGNGGDAVVCRDSSQDIVSSELLDFYEGRVMRGMVFDLDHAGPSYLEKVKFVLNRLKAFAPERANKYSTWLNTFPQESQFLKQVELVDVPDSAHIIFPRNCKVEQLVIQRIPERLSDKRYLINGDLWDLLDENGKAGTVLHELIYREFLELGEVNSISTRYFNALICSTEFTLLSSIDYV
ncbi:MAG: hypothetical protein AB7H97_22630, partial [Pseudobdellovibrionaceae bacterium]